MRCLIADDHRLFLEALRCLLTTAGIEVVGMAHDGFEALYLARDLHPDVILMDVRMPRCSGVEATRLIRAEMPECKIVMLTASEDEDDLFDAVDSGASGYLLKDVNADRFFAYLRDVAANRAVFSDRLAARFLDEFKRVPSTSHRPRPAEDSPGGDDDCPLTSQQMSILMLVAEGHTYNEVGKRMGIAERTVKYHMGEIIDRLHLENRAQAIAYAAGRGRECSNGDH
jgi:DNA-binding NarL/FixJ family response regulator